MPLLRGDEVAERIRKVESDVGLILLTGYKPAISNEVLGRFNFVLEKPVSPGEVLMALKKTVKDAPVAILMG
jgi:CheY-like chemotaxis protein